MKLIMFSGGMDSTYLAWKILKEKTEGVQLHYVSIRNDCENIWKNEDVVTEKIVNYFRKQQFKFRYTTSKFEFYGHGRCGYDSDIILLAAQKMALNSNDNHIEVFLGWNPDDMARQEIAERSERNVTGNIWKALVESCWNRHNINSELQFPFLKDNITKEKMFKDIPKELLDLTWSCRFGIENPCGTCHSCLERNLNMERYNESR